MTTIRIGTRGSRLALWQAQWVADRLREHYPHLSFELATITTTGEMLLGMPPSKLDGEGLFTDKIEEALFEGKIDFAVHSLKDLTNDVPDDLEISAFCQREDPRDVLISKSGLMLQDLPPMSRIGTSSLRRIAQILNLRPDITCVNIRGNIDTRMQKLEDSQDLDGIILAAAGVIRMGWQDRITQYFDEDLILPAAGQGIIAIETHIGRGDIKYLVSALNHQPSEYEACAERLFSDILQGGCRTPIGVRAVFADGILNLKGMVASLDGTTVVRVEASGTDPNRVGRQAANEALRSGATEILEEISRSCGETRQKTNEISYKDKTRR